MRPTGRTWTFDPSRTSTRGAKPASGRAAVDSSGGASASPRPSRSRARDRLRRGEALAPPELSAAARPDAGYAPRVLVRDGSKVHVLPVTKIAFVQAQDDYACFACEGREYLKEQTLGQVEASLDPQKFARIHRSYILNLDFLARVELDERENRVAVLTDGRKLPVSRAGYARLSERL